MHVCIPMAPNGLCQQWLRVTVVCFLTLNAFAEGPVQSVQTEISVSEPIIQRLRLTGSVASPKYSNISSAVAGLVESHDINAGDRIKRGDLLLQLDAETERLALARIRAEHGQAEVELADARRRLAEAERLGRQSDIAETEIESRRAEVSRLEAALEAAKAAVAEQQSIVDRHSVRAPFDGVVIRRSTDLGEWVTPGDTLIELLAIGALWFDFQVPQNMYANVSKESRLVFSLEALPGETIEGQILAIVPMKDPTARTFLLRAVSADDTDRPITPGMSVRGDLLLDTGREAVTVSRDAILRYPDGRTTVWTVVDSEAGPVAEEQLVKTGLEFDARVEIVSGLDAGVDVVAKGNESLRPGQRVQER